MLVIRSARDTVLHAYLQTRHSGDRVTILGQRGATAPVYARWLDAPAGLLEWARFDAELRQALRSTHWSEIVVLHNLSDDSYRHIFALVLRIAPFARLRVFFADGRQQLWRSVITYWLPRLVASGLAAVPLAILIAAALIWSAARRLLAWRRRVPAVTT
ncbi:MAG TPA: hypothetical protein VEA16_01015 [Vicinamibacterales bacterium]|nr:hypothetical protein [Vicinamibacterales bacterium]